MAQIRQTIFRRFKETTTTFARGKRGEVDEEKRKFGGEDAL